MINAAFFVDGHLEKKFIQKTCPNKVVRILNCNGSKVSAAAIAKRISSQCRLLKGRNFPIIIFVDLEDRDETATQFHDDIVAAIRAEGVSDTFILGVADRMIENWILADKSIVAGHTTKRPVYTGCPDGFNGKSCIKQLIPGYHETTIGVDLLEKCRASKMITSPSFKAFFDKLSSYQCWWLNR